jgi:hypothetical protein
MQMLLLTKHKENQKLNIHRQDFLLGMPLEVHLTLRMYQGLLLQYPAHQWHQLHPWRQ